MNKEIDEVSVKAPFSDNYYMVDFLHVTAEKTSLHVLYKGKKIRVRSLKKDPHVMAKCEQCGEKMRHEVEIKFK